MTTNAEAAKAVIDSQAAKGLATYGVGLEASDLSVSALAREGAAEAADLLAYMVALQCRAEAMEADNVRLRSACQAVLDEFPALDHKRIENVKRICRAALAAEVQ